MNKSQPLLDLKTLQSSSQSGAMMISKSTIHASRITSLSSQPNLKSSYHTLLADIKPKSSEKHLPQLLKDSLELCNSTEETLVKKSRPSESWDTLLKSFTCWLEETHWKFSLKLSNSLVQEKIQPKSELVVLPESKLLTSHQWEEST